ncbi:MAG TPA: VOC family protein [Thermohalobaculum sp.]|nr:VOC family protein [Thermohalobaculum sp.]
MRLDHIVVAAARLEEGRAWMQARLGVPARGAGRHAKMGTVNALWGLGASYLEVIAIDPEGAPPVRPRWFGLDDPQVQARLAGGPALVAWAVAVDDLGAIRPPVPCDPPADFARDDLTWQAVLAKGRALPLGGAWPLTIRWTSGLHPAKRLPDDGLRLERLEIAGAGVDQVAAALGEVARPVVFGGPGGPTRLAATIRTPQGVVRL